MIMKQAIHFGAGNIGRGFIGELLVQSGYEVTFVDVNEELVETINAKKGYNIQIVGDEPQTIHIEHVKAINSNTNIEDLLMAIVHADIVTTAIGPNILKFIAPNIAKGLERRVKENTTPLNIIACENMVGGSTVLKNSSMSIFRMRPSRLSMRISASRMLLLTASCRCSTMRNPCSCRSSRTASGMSTARRLRAKYRRSRALPG